MMHITGSIKKIVVVLLVGVLMLILMHAIVYAVYYVTPYEDAGGLLSKFDLDAELSVPTWYAQTLLAIAAGLLIVIGVYRKKQHGPYYVHWLVLGGIFLYISIDEGAAIHELSIEPLRNLLGITEGIFYYAWIIPVAVILAVLAVLYLPFLFHLPKNIRSLFVLAALVYVGGAMGMEMLGGFYVSTYGDGIVYTLIVTVEEVMEKVGVIIFIGALLAYIRDHIGELRISVNS